MYIACMNELLSQEQITNLLHQVDQRIAASTMRAAITIPGSLLSIIATPHQSMLSDIRARLKRLENLQAPLFIENGTGIQRWLKRLANLPIRLVSSKQIIYNQELLDMLSLLLTELEQARRTAAYTAQLTVLIEQQQQQITQLQAQMAALHRAAAATESSAPASSLD
jgi:hypothetical protein